MQAIPDAWLLRDYSENGSENSFREIVNRHADLVYSAALRQVESSALACDVAQAVFTDLARKARTLAGKLSQDASLAGWLCRSTRYEVLNHLRDDRRRTTRERQAMEQLLTDTEPAPDWEQIRPLLDEALAELDDGDREAIVLRYFKNQDFRAVGLALGVSDDTAQKRVTRAVEQLREYFAKRKVAASTGALAALISGNAIQAAPAGLAATLSASALLAGTAVHTSTLIAATKTIAMTTLQKIVVTATVAALAGAGIYEAKQVSQLRNQVQTLQRAQGPLNDQLDTLAAENEKLSNQVAAARDQKALTQSQFNELLKLRGQSGQTQTALKELAKAQSANNQSFMSSAFMTNAFAQGLAMSEKIAKKNALAKLERMQDQLNLSTDQFESISNIMMQNIAQHMQLLQAAMMSGQPPVANAALIGSSEETQIQAQLNADQLAAYPDFKQSENQRAAQSSASSDLTMLVGNVTLTPDQSSQAQAALYQYYLNQANNPSPEAAAIAQARASGDLSTIADLHFQNQKQQLQDKVNALSGILTPDQLKAYEESQTTFIDMEANAAKMFVHK